MLHAWSALGFAFVCIYIEFYVPGAIFGTIGSLLYLLSLVIAFMQGESLGDSFLFLAVALAGLGVIIRFALWQIRCKKGNTTMYLDQDQLGFRAPTYDPSFIGKEGEALCDLRPMGYVIIDEQKCSALSDRGYIDQGCKVLVVRIQGSDVIVQPLIQAKE